MKKNVSQVGNKEEFTDNLNLRAWDSGWHGGKTSTDVDRACACGNQSYVKGSMYTNCGETLPFQIQGEYCPEDKRIPGDFAQTGFYLMRKRTTVVDRRGGSKGGPEKTVRCVYASRWSVASFPALSTSSVSRRGSSNTNGFPEAKDRLSLTDLKKQTTQQFQSSRRRISTTLIQESSMLRRFSQSGQKSDKKTPTPRNSDACHQFDNCAFHHLDDNVSSTKSSDNTAVIQSSDWQPFRRLKDKIAVTQSSDRQPFRRLNDNNDVTQSSDRQPFRRLNDNNDVTQSSDRQPFRRLNDNTDVAQSSDRQPFRRLNDNIAVRQNRIASILKGSSSTCRFSRKNVSVHWSDRYKDHGLETVHFYEREVDTTPKKKTMSPAPLLPKLFKLRPTDIVCLRPL